MDVGNINRILIIEDNLGDFVLIEDYLIDKFKDSTIHQASSFLQSAQILKDNEPYNLILLDLNLPDLQGLPLVERVLSFAKQTPVIVLTGYTDVKIAKETLAMGIVDFLIKDEVNPEILYRSAIYAVERERFISGLSASKKKYQELFDLSPQPMWIYDCNTLHFLEVNEAAIKKYSYSKTEFLQMTIKDIRPKEDLPYLEQHLLLSKTEKVGNTIFTHLLKSGEQIEVQIYSEDITFNDQTARLVLANDITEQQKYQRTIEKQNENLRNIAWTQSHVVRAPLSRMLGLINLLEAESFKSEDLPFLMNSFKNSLFEMDAIIIDIVNKTQSLNLNEKENG